MLRGDGSGRLLGRYTSGTWSPNGRFVAVTRDNVLYAVEPGTGTVRWPLVRKAPLADVRWAPKDGFRIAYREGTDLRVVDGDGTHDRLLARGVGATPATWRPDTHVLAYDQGDGAVTVVDVDGGEPLSLPVPGQVRSLLFSADGRTLLVATDRELVSLDPASGELHRLVAAPPAAIATSPAAPGDVVAVLARGAVHRIATDGSATASSRPCRARRPSPGRPTGERSSSPMRRTTAGTSSTRPPAVTGRSTASPSGSTRTGSAAPASRPIAGWTFLTAAGRRGTGMIHSSMAASELPFDRSMSELHARAKQ